ncbi:hypothetical protein LPJGGPFB_01395 [Ensifer adhaerens]|nr:hypothetical protein [Ensifer adhaerens]
MTMLHSLETSPATAAQTTWSAPSVGGRLFLIGLFLRMLTSPQPSWLECAQSM